VSEIRRYLLGQLDAAEREAVEARLFGDTEFLELVEAEEEELLDQYVAGRLTAKERQAWESYRAVRPDLMRREPFARALRQRLRRGVAWWRWVAAVAALVVVGWFWMQPPRETILAVTLTAGTLRGSENAQVVRIGGAVTALAVNFGNREAVRWQLRAVDGGPVAAGELRDGVARVPRLAPGDYVATVADAKGEELADYVFRVVTGD
jgi:anti-sigma factor RsiW